MPVSVHTPAFTWRAFFVFTLLFATAAHAGPAAGTNQPPPGYLQIGKPDQEEGRRVLASFRQAGIPGQYYLEFEIHVLPRRGDESVLKGRLWGSRNEQGAITRVSVFGANGGERRLLIQNGPQATVWRADLGGASVTTQIVDAFEPLIPGVELTAFELQMPYIYWTDATLEQVGRVRSRPAHVFFFRPPFAWSGQHREVGGVRAYLDTQFNVPVQSELIAQDGRVLRTLSLVDLKKVGEQYIPKTIDLRNDRTRDKTRFQVTGAALNQNFPAAIFEPGQLAEDSAAPRADQIVPVAP